MQGQRGCLNVKDRLVQDIKNKYSSVLHNQKEPMK